jgi:TolB-like protein
VAAWVLLQVADVIRDEFPVDMRLVLTAAIVGFPIALVAGWLYDITRKGILRTPPVSTDDSFDPRLGLKDFAILSVLAIVWVAGVYIAYTPPATDRSIAVLPFENRSHDPDSLIFAFGVRDDLNVHLGRVGALRVIASSSVDQVDLSLSVDRIGAQLDVAYLLRGSVDRIADRVRINVTLIESANATQAWAGSFDRELSTEGLFDIRSDIANAITSELRAKLTESEQLGLDDRPTEDLAAWEAFVRGRYLLEQRTPNSKQRAVRELKKAASLDPDFAMAHAELAMSLMLGGSSETEWGPYFAEIEPHVDKAMALNPGLAESHAAKAWLLRQSGNAYQAGSDQVLAHFRRATELNPSYSIAYVWLSGNLSRPDETFAALETALRLDPLSRPGNWAYISSLIERNRLAEADRQIEEFASIAPGAATLLRGIRLSIGGNWASYILAHLKVASRGTNDLVFGGGSSYMLMRYLGAIGLGEEALLLANGHDPEALMAFGYPEEAIALAQSQHAEDPDAVGSLIMGFVLAHAGHYAEARPYLEDTWRQWGMKFTADDFFTSYLSEALIAVRHDAGDEAGADEILAALTDNVRRLRDGGIVLTSNLAYSVDYQEGIAAYLAGERDTALTLMSKAAEDGFWIPPVSVFQESRFRDPDFALILERQKAQETRERKRVLAVVCNDNPYAVVWQPAEETCEQFAASSEN